MTQSTLVEAMKKEDVPFHPHYLEGGAMHRKAPHATDGAIVIAEMDKMMQGDEGSAFYLAFQPLLNGAQATTPPAKWLKTRHTSPGEAGVEIGAQAPHREAGEDETTEMTCVAEELLLRAKDGTQNFPTAVAYHLPAAKRQEFALWQTAKAVERAEQTGRCAQVNWWEADLEVMQGTVLRVCKGRNVRIELTEYKKDSDTPGYPALTTFTINTLRLMAKLHYGGVKLSLDDCNWIQEAHPCNFQFALDVAPYLDQVKLDIKACAQVYDMLPNVPCAAKFAPLEPDDAARARKARELVDFVAEMRHWKRNLGLVIELSVCSRALADKFPSFNVFDHQWVLVQGGLTNNWAMKA